MGPTQSGTSAWKCAPIRTAVLYDLLSTNMACIGLFKILLPSPAVSPCQLDCIACLLREQVRQYQSNQSSSSPRIFVTVLQQDRWYAASQQSHINILEDSSNLWHALHRREALLLTSFWLKVCEEMRWPWSPRSAASFSVDKHNFLQAIWVRIPWDIFWTGAFFDDFEGMFPLFRVLANEVLVEHLFEPRPKWEDWSWGSFSCKTATPPLESLLLL